MDTVDDAPIADIKRVHNEDENDGFEDGFAGVLEHESNEEKLGGNNEEDLSGGYAKDQKRNDNDDHNHDGASQLVELLDGGFGVIQRMSQCLPLYVGMNHPVSESGFGDFSCFHGAFKERKNGGHFFYLQESQ